MLPRPTNIGAWDIASVVHQESASILASTLVLKEPGPLQIHEIFSMRATMSEDGTGDLASMGFGTVELPGGLTNSDNLLLELRSETKVGGADPGNVWWHMGRSNQLGLGLGENTVMLPPEFWWEGEIHGIFQNAAGATVDFLYTIIYRELTFSRKDWVSLANQLLPRRGVKHLTFTA